MRHLTSFLSLAALLAASPAQADLRLTFERCKPISPYRVEIAYPEQVQGLSSKQRAHVERFRRTRQTGAGTWPIYLLQPRPEMTDLTFVLAGKECASLCTGYAYWHVGRQIREIPFQYKHNFIDDVRLTYDVHGRRYPNKSGFRSVTFYVLAEGGEKIRYFERSKYNAVGPYVDRDPAWKSFFPKSRLRVGVLELQAWGTSKFECLRYERETTGTASPYGNLQPFGQRGYPRTPR